MTITHNTIQYKRGVGAFKTRGEAERALHRLRDAGVDMNHVTVMAPDTDSTTFDRDAEVESHGNKADEGATAGAVTGGALGTLTGLLVGLGALAIPGVGPILLAGAGATTLATTLAGTAIGAAAGGIVGALVGLGIPEEQAKVYNQHLTDGRYLVLVTGTPGVMDKVETIMRSEGIHDWGVYDAPDIDTEVVNPDTQPIAPPPAATPVAPTKPTTPTTSTTTSTGTTVASTTTTNEPPVVIVDKRDKTRENL
ncbi:MAG: DUF1269 domain-containing protein [Microcoleaceae cyanobacterium]